MLQTVDVGVDFASRARDATRIEHREATSCTVQLLSQASLNPRGFRAVLNDWRPPLHPCLGFAIRAVSNFDAPAKSSLHRSA